ncbi:BON domain-containing protein [Acidipila sp. EB88]|nr:BON domain-containing protein [Acidipila sp. EB88]
MLTLLLAGSLVLAPGALQSRAASVPLQADASQLQTELSKTLNKKQFSGVQGSVQGTTALLKGTVDVFDDKEEAGKRARHVKGITAVDNEIQVAGPSVPDAELQQKLVKAISYDRVGYGTTAFNAVSVVVHGGNVTLGGHAYGPVDAASAVAVASNTKGVRDVINEIQVDPTSPMDDRIRIQAARTIYGFPSLNKYAIDPAKPIRISVQNGNLTLYGVVNSQSDKDVAGLRANSVPGVFKVVNNLQVATSSEGR